MFLDKEFKYSIEVSLPEDNYITSIKVTSDFRYITCWYHTCGSVVYFIDIEKNKIIKTFGDDNEKRVKWVDISPNNKFFALAYENGLIEIGDLENLSIIKRIKLYNYEAYYLKFNDSSSFVGFLGNNSNNSLLNIFSLEDLSIVNTIDVSGNLVAELLFVDRDKVVETTKGLKIWDIYSKLIFNINKTNIINSLLEDCLSISSIFNNKALKLATTYDREYIGVCQQYEPDKILIINNRFEIIEKINLEFDMSTDGLDSFVQFLGFSPDSKYILISDTSSILIFHVKTGVLVRYIYSRISIPTFSPDGKYLIYSDDNKTIKFFEFEIDESDLRY